jgi:hypothetical protein
MNALLQQAIENGKKQLQIMGEEAQERIVAKKALCRRIISNAIPEWAASFLYWPESEPQTAYLLFDEFTLMARIDMGSITWSYFRNSSNGFKSLPSLTTFEIAVAEATADKASPCPMSWFSYTPF